MGLHEAAILKITLFLPPNLDDSIGLSCNYFKALPIYRYIPIYVPRNAHIYKEIHIQTLQNSAASHLTQRVRTENEGPFPFQCGFSWPSLAWSGQPTPNTKEKFP